MVKDGASIHGKMESGMVLIRAGTIMDKKVPREVTKKVNETENILVGIATAKNGQRGPTGTV